MTAFICQIIVQFVLKPSWLAAVRLPLGLDSFASVPRTVWKVVAGDLAKNLHLVLPLRLGEAHLLEELQVGGHVLSRNTFTLLLE